MFCLLALVVGFWFGSISGAWLVVRNDEKGPTYHHDVNYEDNIRKFFAEHRGEGRKLRRVK